jgi:uncharacterized protein (DUF1778 family)
VFSLSLATENTEKKIFAARRIMQIMEEYALLAAKAAVKEAEHVQLSRRDSLRVLALLENPPAPNSKLLAAARALPKRARS